MDSEQIPDCSGKSVQQYRKMMNEIKDLLRVSYESSKQLLDGQSVEALEQRLPSIQQLKDCLIKFLQMFLNGLISRLSKQNQAIQLNVSAVDYLALEQTLQKIEAENRNHICIEQQMHLYTESLEQRIEEGKGELNIQVKKNAYLSEKIKILQGENKKWQEQFGMVSKTEGVSRCESNDTTVHSFFKNEFLQSKPSLKSKNIVDKIAQRAQRISDKKLNDNLKFQMQENRLNVISRNVSQKDKLFDRDIRRKHVSHEGSIRDLSRQIHKQLLQKKQSRRISKNRTEETLTIVQAPRRNSSSKYY